ncbi:PilZ domain-containing protein [Yunchengibacter salinarum]|uniref:PilZ domain-containing protein n=1 Tax=Yunchengibacter salinarum TaxID=3133399 RepID=UPI0035B5F3A5
MAEENRRQHVRRSVLWPATVHVAGHDSVCRVRNLSLGGVRLDCSLPLRVGASVRLTVEDRPPLSGVVSWSVGDGLGIAFDDPPARIRALFADRASALGLSETVPPPAPDAGEDSPS